VHTVLTDRSAAQGHLDLFEIVDRTPTLGDEAFLRHVQVEHVERVVDGFDLAHFDEPHFDVLGGCNQHAMTVVLRLAQHLHHIYLLIYLFIRKNRTSQYSTITQEHQIG